ncbi:MAG: methyltransferase domain-containing protein [Alphaproteobacteria bacterium]
MPPPTERAPRQDDWTQLDAAGAAAAIAKLEALGQSAGGTAARARCLALLDLAPGQSVLDVGAGTGLASIEIARRVAPGGAVVGLEPSAPLRAFARAAADRSGVGPAIEWREGRADALPFPDGRFDRAFCHWVLLHVEAAEATLREMRRVTRRGGRVMCVEVDWETVTVHPAERDLARRILHYSCDRHIEGWSGRRLPALLRACGLDDVSVEPIVLFDDGGEDQAWLRFLHQRGDMAAAAGAISRAEAAGWRERLDAAAVAGRLFFSVTQFAVRGSVR